MQAKCCIKCCNAFPIGCVSVCNDLVIGYAVSAGQYTLLTEFNGRVMEITKEFQTGEILRFPLSGLNESYKFCAQILRPGGEQMKFLHAGVCYDGFTFQTNLGVCKENVITNFEICV